ncbi:hypothetical protein ACOME3_007386 [Neoechinorhynchus agilis]
MTQSLLFLLCLFLAVFSVAKPVEKGMMSKGDEDTKLTVKRQFGGFGRFGGGFGCQPVCKPCCEPDVCCCCYYPPPPPTTPCPRVCCYCCYNRPPCSTTCEPCLCCC